MWIDASVCPLSLRSRTVPVVCASVRLSPSVRLFLALCLVRGLCLCLYLRLCFARSLERAPAVGRTAGFLSRARTDRPSVGWTRDGSTADGKCPDRSRAPCLSVRTDRGSWGT